MAVPTALGQTATIGGVDHTSYEIATGVFGWKPVAAAASSTAERTRFLTAMPVPGTDLKDGEQATIEAGNPLESMMFENVGGVIVYRGQSGFPFRTTLKSSAERAAVAAALPSGGVYWYLLTQDDTPNAALKGYYSISQLGIQSGPHNF